MRSERGGAARSGGGPATGEGHSVEAEFEARVDGANAVQAGARADGQDLLLRKRKGSQTDLKSYKRFSPGVVRRARASYSKISEASVLVLHANDHMI